MTPQQHCDTTTAKAAPVAVFVRPPVVKKRADFLRAANALRQGTTGFHLQARNRGDADAFRVGYTCSKKVGNAVARNRAKRRLREIARLVMNQHGRAGWDYVLIGRKDVTADYDFARMQKDLIWALKKVHSK
ncbi:ribonuclease P protein component [Marivivens niveibacter]|uniref:Ribonuclease P protein component n=1 Tax=Marivivens niveibacter TaxID=1930667 RepID=A0A251WZ08_9RHOB|nr:ribonuclease P protein component [Marivivens niveibacter]OUD09375.1 ribonuclease P protein component [Marivivens niveibacter]